MSWITIAIIAYLILAIVNLIDKYLIDQALPSSKVYTALISVLSGAILILAPWYLNWPGWYWFIFNILGGAFFVPGLYFMFEALKWGDASRVNVLVGGTIPILTGFLSYFILKEVFNLYQIIGITFLVSGTFVMAYLPTKIKSTDLNYRRLWLLVILSSFFFAIFFIATKYAFDHQPFISSFIWLRLGALLASLSFFIRLRDRQEIFKALKKQSGHQRNRILIVGGQLMGALAFLMQNYAIKYGSVAIVNSLQGVQYTFLLIFGWLLTIYKPQMIKEDVRGRVVWQKLFAIFLVGIGLYYISI